MASEIGYEQDVCFFCGGPEAGYGRREDGQPKGPYHDACQSCAEKPYPQPVQFMNKEQSEFD